MWPNEAKWARILNTSISPNESRTRIHVSISSYIFLATMFLVAYFNPYSSETLKLENKRFSLCSLTRYAILLHFMFNSFCCKPYYLYMYIIEDIDCLAHEIVFMWGKFKHRLALFIFKHMLFFTSLISNMGIRFAMGNVD